METSIFLAKAIGLFGTISTLAIISRYKLYLQIEAEAEKSLSTIYLTGFIILILGILITISHPVWVMDWRVIITILGWLTLLKGVMRIFMPELIQQLIAKKQREKRFIFAEIGVLLISLYLVYQGFQAN